MPSIRWRSSTCNRSDETRFADAYRYVSDPRTMTVTPAQCSTEATSPAEHAASIPTRAGLSTWHTAASRHRLSHRRRRKRHDGVADPIELHGFWFWHRRSWNRHQPPESWHRILASTWSPESVGGGKRPFHTIIPGFMTKDGDAFASFGIMGGADPAARHLQTLRSADRLSRQPAGDPRCAALEGQWRLIDRSGS